MTETTKSIYSAEAFEAMKHKDIDAIKAILSKNVHPDELKDEYNNTLLYDLVKFTLYGFDEADFELYKLLLEQGADPHQSDFVPLIHCLCKRKEVFGEEMIRLAIAHKADIHSFAYHEKKSLLQSAAHYGNTWFVKYLIEQGLDVNYEDAKGQNVLYEAIDGFHGTIETVQCLLDNGANKQDLFKLYDGHLILENLQSSNKIDLLNYLVSLGVDINATNKGGTSIIVYSAEYGPAEMFTAILDAGAHLDDCLSNVLHRIEYRMSCKHAKKAEVENAFEKLKILYNRNYPVNKIDYYGYNAYDILTSFVDSMQNRKTMKKYEENVILALLEMGFVYKGHKYFLEYLQRINNVRIINYLEANQKNKGQAIN